MGRRCNSSRSAEIKCQALRSMLIEASLRRTVHPIGPIDGKPCFRNVPATPRVSVGGRPLEWLIRHATAIRADAIGFIKASLAFARR
jgi:hypothetical protein